MNKVYVAIEFDEKESRGSWAYNVEAKQGHRIQQAGADWPATRRNLLLTAAVKALGRLPIQAGEAAVFIPDEDMVTELRSLPGEPSALPGSSLGADDAKLATKLARLAGKRGITWVRIDEEDLCAGMVEARRLAANERRLTELGRAADQAPGSDA